MRIEILRLRCPRFYSYHTFVLFSGSAENNESSQIRQIVYHIQSGYVILILYLCQSIDER